MSAGRLTLLVALLLPAMSLAAPPSTTRETLICRAKSGLGFSYWWGNGSWCANGCSPDYSCGKGNCTPNAGSSGCPKCSHSGSKGADCSGYVARVWDVPSAKPLSTNWHPYSTFNFYWESTHWDHIDKSAAKKGDALTYRKLTSSGKDCLYSDACSSGGHIVLYESGDPYGYSYVNHAKGCLPDILYENKYIDSKYRARRRHNILDGVCTPGQSQSQACGNCGSQSRTCGGNGQWSGWSTCSGQGECAKGATESQSCGDCGSQTRTCSGSCQWGGWGSCQEQGTCVPGEEQSESCGLCGSRTRSCVAGCQWGQWSGCAGQGVCAPGQQESEACGDCGTRTRQCGGLCHWVGWGDCSGPDPEEGNLPCDSGLSGPCAEGRVRCVSGWTACASIVSPVPELCDGLDNDCDGLADNGEPLEFGLSAPLYAAELVDLSFPRIMMAGASAQVWADFRNVGLLPWPKRGLWLQLAEGGQSSPLYDAHSWAAWDVASVLQQVVEPGETGRFVFTLHAPPGAQAGLAAHLVLASKEGAVLRCPQPSIHLDIDVIPPDDEALEGAVAPGAGEEVWAQEGDVLARSISPLSLAEPTAGGCGTAPTSTGAIWPLVLLLVVLLSLWRTTRLLR